MLTRAYVGTYADKIYSLYIDTDQKRFGARHALAELDAPSYCVTADGKYLIVCSEVERFGGGYGGGLVSYAIGSDGSLSELSRVNAGGTVTCHVAYDSASRRVAAANYGDGSFAVCRIDAGGMLSEPHIFIRHAGGGPDKSRQAGPHAHQCTFAADGTLWVCDLGLDAAIQYELRNGSARELHRLHTPPGSGARHIVFDRDGKYAYVICEMASCIAAFSLDRSGGISPDTIYPLTDGARAQTGAAAIKYRDGIIIATNRFADNISMYSEDGSALELCDRVRCGRIPRDASFVPDAELVVAGFQDDGRAALYDISRGKLELADEIEMPSPSCFVF